MFLRSSFLFLIILVTTLGNLMCEEIVTVNLVCSRLYLYPGGTEENYDPNYYQRLESSTLSVSNSKTILGQTFFNNGSEVDTSEITTLVIETERKTVLFMPQRIKKKLPKLTRIFIINSGLFHLEREDMRQFGDDLITADFRKNSLDALEGDLFEFNKNLRYIDFRGNSLSFINPALFENFKTMHLMVADFGNNNCINQIAHSNAIRTGNHWDLGRCNNQHFKIANTRRINERKPFFKVILLENRVKQQESEINALKNMMMVRLIITVLIFIALILLFCSTPSKSIHASPNVITTILFTPKHCNFSYDY